MQPDNQNQFDFILDPTKQKPAGPAFLQDPKKRIISVVVFVISILILIIIAVAVFSSLSKKNTSALVEVAAYQTELVRIGTIGLEGATDASVRSQTSTINTVMQSDLAKTNAYLGSVGKKLTELESSSKLNSKVEKELESASLKNTYDEELLSIIEKTSAEYKLALQRALDNASSEKEKSLIQSAAVNILTYEKP